MRFQASKQYSFVPALAACLLLAPAFTWAGPTTVSINPEERNRPRQQQEAQPAFHRKLWTGKFDIAGDESGNVAKQLKGGLQFNCDELSRDTPSIGRLTAKPANMAAYQDCRAREAAAASYGQQAASISKQQHMMSLLSKTSDLAALASVGGVVYAEMGVKKNGQDDTYDSAAKIQRVAGTASYVTGATDLTLGAWAFVAQKRKLEEMQKTLTGNGAQTNNAALNNSLVNAVEATKKAAYSHMLWGAGKVAAGYGMMKLAERSEKQAESMRSLQELQDLNAYLAMRNAQGQPMINPAQVAIGGGGAAPYYQNNQPAFVFPTGNSTSLAPSPNAVNYGIPSGGASVAPGNLRNPASNNAFQPKSSGAPGGGGGGAGTDGTGASAPLAAGEESPAKTQAARDALGNHFEANLTGGPRPYAGGASEPPKDAVPDIAAMLNPGASQANTQTAATGLSPTQMYSTALEGTDGAEQGSMAGVNGKSETSLFLITREKLNKMFQVGNVGIPKDVEVRN